MTDTYSATDIAEYEAYMAKWNTRSARFIQHSEDSDLCFVLNARVSKSDTGDVDIVDVTTGELIWTQNISNNSYFRPYGFFNSPYEDTVFVVYEPHRMYCIYEDKWNNDQYYYKYLLKLGHHNCVVSAMLIGAMPKYPTTRIFEPMITDTDDYCYDPDAPEEQVIIYGCDEYVNVTDRILENMFENTLVTIPIHIFY